MPTLPHHHDDDQDHAHGHASAVPLGASVSGSVPADAVEAVARVGEDCRRLRGEIGKVIVGQDEIVEQLLTALLARGHALLVGVPGLAKTLLVRTVARALSLSFHRIQFTPDMMPSDITGTDILQDDPETGRRRFVFIHGPLFANLVLADEINRTPPKTQAALLEAMQEQHVTAGGRTYELPPPFFVLATQNPIEQEGTYPLPEAQLDRFLLNIRVPYPTPDEELRILRATTGAAGAEPQVVLSAERVVEIQGLVRRVPVPDHVFKYARDLVRATRPGTPEATEMVGTAVAWGAGPRAGQALILCAKAHALIQGRFAVGVADVRHVAPPVLRHRIVTTFRAEAEGVDSDAVIARLIQDVPAATERATASRAS
jgi:MoxR-like ATPase